MKTPSAHQCLFIVIVSLGLCGSSPGQESFSGIKPHDSPPLITIPLEQVPLSPTDAKTNQSPDKIVDEFFILLEQGQIDQAYDHLTNGTKIAEKPDDVVTLKNKTREAVKLFGDIRGYEKITVKNVGTHLMCATYLSLGRICPLRWKFYFYKSENAWQLIDIGVDDRLVDMFDDRTPHSQSGGSDQ